MKKYVLNIDRIFGGQTANALVLKQVDEDFPHLLPSLDAQGEHARLTVGEWIQDMQKFHRDFDPIHHAYSVVFTFIPQGQTVKEQSTERHAFLSNLNVNTTMSVASTRRIEHPEDRQKTTDATVLDLLKDYIVEFNLMKQDEFKQKGHRELYMMDDSWRGTRSAEVETEESGKTLMHCLDGIGSESGKFMSQLNPIFPFRKMSNKSLYASQLRIRKPGEMDDYLERARNITLQGKVSYQKCLQEVQCVGGNLYMMSPTVEIGTSDPDSLHIFGNGLTVVNGYGTPYHFPHSMTMFQPSQSEYRESNIEPFIEWCKDHNRKTMVSFKETYGSNTSDLKCLGNGSYELELATYSPTDIVLWSEDGSRKREYRLNSETYRDIRAERDASNRYRSGKYIFDNGIFDNEKEDEYTHVGFMFNLYDTFITGNDRILHMTVPRNSDYNSLVLKFDWMPVVGEIPGEMEVEITVNEKNVIPQSENNRFSSGVDYGFSQYSLEIVDTATESTDIEIAVRIHYQVDFGRRSQELAYRENLMKSGVVLRDIRIENGITGSQKWLTFADYVNEDGIDDETRASRLDEFWVVSRYKKDVAYQTVLESPVRNVISSGVAYPNNYSSGDMYGDVFVTKSVLDPRYDMNIRQSPDDENTLIGIARDYIGMGSCSDQLSLLYHPVQMAMGRRGETDVVTTRETPEEYTQLKYQMVEVVKNVNKFESSIKHKSNVFSVVVENSNLAKGEVDPDDERQAKIETYKKHLRDSITQFVRDTCQGIVPVHTQLFDVQFT